MSMPRGWPVSYPLYLANKSNKKWLLGSIFLSPELLKRFQSFLKPYPKEGNSPFFLRKKTIFRASSLL
jgi:hypothetical protein